MKPNKICGILYLLSGLILAIGPQTFIPVCPTDEKVMRCYYAVRGVLALGLLLAVIGVLSLCFSKGNASAVTGIMAVCCSGLSIAIPAFLIGGCAKTTMLCQTTAFPAIYLLSGVGLASGIAQLVFWRKRGDYRA